MMKVPRGKKKRQSTIAPLIVLGTIAGLSGIVPMVRSSLTHTAPPKIPLSGGGTTNPSGLAGGGYNPGNPQPSPPPAPSPPQPTVAPGQGINPPQAPFAPSGFPSLTNPSNPIISNQMTTSRRITVYKLRDGTVVFYDNINNVLVSYNTAVSIDGYQSINQILSSLGMLNHQIKIVVTSPQFSSVTVSGTGFQPSTQFRYRMRVTNGTDFFSPGASDVSSVYSVTSGDDGTINIVNPVGSGTFSAGGNGYIVAGIFNLGSSAPTDSVTQTDTIATSNAIPLDKNSVNTFNYLTI